MTLLHYVEWWGISKTILFDSVWSIKDDAADLHRLANMDSKESNEMEN